MTNTGADKMSNTYVVADMHGRFDLLCRAIDLIEADAGEAGGTFIVLGDFVDRGPQSRNIIDLLMAGPQRPNWRWIVLQGNHEAMMLECLANPGILRWWIGNGGGQTLESYGYKQGNKLHPLKIPAEHLEWLAGLPITHEDDHRIFVHAGVPFDQLVADAKQETLQWMLYPGDVDHSDAASGRGAHQRQAYRARAPPVCHSPAAENASDQSRQLRLEHGPSRYRCFRRHESRPRSDHGCHRERGSQGN